MSKQGKHNQNLKELIEKRNKLTGQQQQKDVEKCILREFNFMRFDICENNMDQKKFSGTDSHDCFFEWYVFHNGNS